MVKKCADCKEDIEEEDGKLQGTMIKISDEKGKKQFIYVCSDCEKKKNYIERAAVRAA